MVEFFKPENEAEIRRRRMMAEQMRQQSQMPQQTQVVSGFAVPQSPLAGLASALGQGLAGYQSGEADRIANEDAQQRQKFLIDAIKGAGGDAGLLAESLISNPAYADQGLEMYGDRMKSQQENAQWEKEAGLKRDLAGMKQGVTIGENGQLVVTGGKKMTEGQANANIYASRMENAEGIIDKNQNAGLSAKQQVLGGIPLVGNLLVNQEYQLLEQAQRDFINATLRKESGAVISAEDFANGTRQYFPQVGDTPATLAQKKRNREIATITIRQASGQPSLTRSGNEASGQPSLPQGGNDGGWQIEEAQ